MMSKNAYVKYTHQDLFDALLSLARLSHQSPPKLETEMPHNIINTRTIDLEKVRTQKARGIIGLYQGYFPVFNTVLAYRPHDVFLVQGEENIDGNYPYPLFARPCPLRPRHGFVESRLVNNSSDLTRVWKEARAEDADAEVILMPKLRGALSAVATNAGVTFGYGHDGVTSGQGITRLIPGKVPVLVWNRTLFGRNEGLDIHDTAYVELVENSTYSGFTAVQVRDGPSQSVERSFIPQPMTVTKILEIGKRLDLITWERNINRAVRENNGKPDGLVFYFPNGNLASHYSIHAIQLGVAVICELYPDLRIGTRLRRTVAQRPTLKAKDYKFLAERIAMLFDPSKFSLRKVEARYTICTAMATIHAMSTWGKEPHLLSLQAAATVILSRYILGITTGEARHFYGDAGPGRFYVKKIATTDWKPLIGSDRPNPSRHERGEVVNAVLDVPFDRLITLQSTVVDDHSMKGWHGGYGGAKWARVSKVNLRLLKAIDGFVKHPGKIRWRRVLLLLNRTVNMLHNGGEKLLSKYVVRSVMDSIAKCPTLGFLNPIAGHFVLDDLTYFHNSNWSNPYDTETQTPPLGKDSKDELIQDIIGKELRKFRWRERRNVLPIEELNDTIPF